MDTPVPQEFLIDAEVPSEFKADAEVPKEFLTSDTKQEGSLVGAVGELAKEVVMPLVDIPAAGVGALIEMTGKGLKEMSLAMGGGEGFYKDIEEYGKTVATPRSKHGADILEGIGIPFKAWDDVSWEAAEQHRDSLRNYLINDLGWDPENARVAAALVGAPEEAITRGAPYLLGLKGAKGQVEAGAALLERKFPAKETPSKVYKGETLEIPRTETQAPASKLNVDAEGNFTYPIENYDGIKVGEQVGKVKDGVLTVDAAAIPDANWRGQGFGTDALASLVDEAGRNGLRVESNSNLSYPRWQNYQNLIERGYKVEINPSIIEDVTMEGTEVMHRFYTEDGGPVAKVYPKAEPTPPELDAAFTEALKEQARRGIEKSLDKNIRPTKDIGIVDWRPLSEVENELVKKSRNKSTKYTDEGPVDEIRTDYVATQEDLPNRYNTTRRYFTAGAGKWIPPSYVASITNNRVVKWVTSLLEKEEMYTDGMREKILYGSEPVKKMGRYIMQSTDRGLIPQFRALDATQKSFFLNILDDYNQGAVREFEITRDVLEARAKAAGIPMDKAKPAIDYYYNVRQAIDGLVNKVEATSKSLEQAGSDRGLTFERHPGYFPNMWDGDFLTTAWDPKTNTTLEAKGSRTKAGTLLEEKRLSDKYPGMSIKTMKREFNRIDPAYEALQNIIRRAEASGEAEVAGAARELAGAVGVRQHRLSRTGVRGFNHDLKVHTLKEAADGFENSLSQFTGAILRAESSLRVKFNMDNMERGPIGRLYPNAVSWSKALSDDYFGRKPWLDERMQEIVGDYIGQTGGRELIGFTSKYMTRIQLLMGHMFHIAIQPSQYRHTLAKMAGMSGEIGRTRDAIIAPFEAMDSILRRDPEMEGVLKTAAQAGAIEPSMARFLYESESSLAPKSKEYLLEKIKGIDKHAYGYLDELQRTVSVASFYMYLKRAGQNSYDATMGAIRLANQTSVKYSPSETPAVYRGIAGSAIGKYQRWAATETAALLEAFHAAKDRNNFKQLGVLIAGTATVTGLSGLWGVRDADNVVEATNRAGITNWKLPSMWIHENSPEWAAVGPVQSYLNMDISVTASPQMVRNFSELPMLTFASNMVKNIGGYAVKKATGRATLMDLEAAVMSTTPVAWKEFVRSGFERGTILPLKEGESYIQHSLSTGKGLYEVDRDSQLRRYFGGRTLQDAKIELMAKWMYSVDAGATNTLNGLTDFVAKQIIMGQEADFGGVIAEAAQKWNLSTNEINRKIRSKVNAGYNTLEHRLLSDKKKQQRTSGKAVDFLHKEGMKESEVQP